MAVLETLVKCGASGSACALCDEGVSLAPGGIQRPASDSTARGTITSVHRHLRSLFISNQTIIFRNPKWFVSISLSQRNRAHPHCHTFSLSCTTISESSLHKINHVSRFSSRARCTNLESQQFACSAPFQHDLKKRTALFFTRPGPSFARQQRRQSHFAFPVKFLRKVT